MADSIDDLIQSLEGDVTISETKPESSDQGILGLRFICFDTVADMISQTLKGKGLSQDSTYFDQIFDSIFMACRTDIPCHPHTLLYEESIVKEVLAKLKKNISIDVWIFINGSSIFSR